MKRTFPTTGRSLARNILLAGFVLVFCSPFLASAEAPQVNTRYCPDPSKIFNGSIYYENDRAWVEVVVDPVFEAKMVKERSVSKPLPLTPIYDLVVRIKPEFNYYCIPGWVQGQPVTAEKLPGSISAEGFLTIGSYNEKILGPGAFVRTKEKDEQGRFIYEWKITGWPNGIASGEKMEKLIEAITKKSLVNAVVEVTPPDKETVYEESQVSFGLCAPVWGNGDKRVVSLRGDSLKSVISNFLSYADATQKKLTTSGGMFASSAKQFSFFIDLKKSRDTSITSLTSENNGRDVTSVTSYTELLSCNRLDMESSCGIRVNSSFTHSFVLFSPVQNPFSVGDFSSNPSIATYTDSNGPVYANICQSPLPTPFLTAKRISNSNIALTWTTTSSEEDGFKVLRRIGRNGPYSEIGFTGKGVKKFNDKNPVKGDLNYYAVYAYNSTNKSNTSSAGRDTYADVTPPSAPVLTLSTYYSKYTVNGVVSWVPRIKVRWAESSDDDDNYNDRTLKAWAYNLYRFNSDNKKSTVGSNLGRSDVTHESVTFENVVNDEAKDILKVGSTYCYVATASDQSGNVSGESAKVCITIPPYTGDDAPANSASPVRKSNTTPADRRAAKESDSGADEPVAVGETPNAVFQTEPGKQASSAGSGQAREVSVDSAPPLKSGTKVKVRVPESQTPPAELEALDAAEAKQVKGPDACLDATAKGLFDKKQQPFRADMEKGWKNGAECAQGIADATALEQKKSDLKASIAVIQNLIGSLALSAEETRNTATLDGSSFYIIPSGEQNEKLYGGVGGVSLQCVSGATVPVGVSSTSKGKTYAGISPKLETEAQTLKQKNAARHDAYLREPEKNRGTVNNATLDRLGGLADALKGNFILVTANAFSKYQRSAALSGSALSLGVSLERGDDQQAKQCTSFAWGVPTKLAFGGVKGDFLMSTVTFDGQVFPHDCVPESYLLGELKAGITKNLAYFEKLQADYTAQLGQVEQELAALKAVNYYCAPPANAILASVAPSGEDASSRVFLNNPGKTADSASGVRVAVPPPDDFMITSPAEGATYTPGQSVAVTGNISVLCCKGYMVRVLVDGEDKGVLAQVMVGPGQFVLPFSTPPITVPAMAGAHTISVWVMGSIHGGFGWGGSDTRDIGRKSVAVTVSSAPNLSVNPVCDAKGTARFHRYNQLSWSPVAGATEYRVYAEQYGETPEKIISGWSAPALAAVTDAASTRAPADKRPTGTAPFTLFYDNGYGHGGPFPSIGRNYSYKVAALVNGKEGGFSNVVSQEGYSDDCPVKNDTPIPAAVPIPPPAPTPAPVVIAVTSAPAVCGAKTRLTWPPVTGAAGYRVYRSVIAAGPYAEVTNSAPAAGYVYSGTPVDYTDVSGKLNAGTTYFYKVTAYDASAKTAGEGGPVSATPSEPCPPTPPSPTGTPPEKTPPPNTVPPTTPPTGTPPLQTFVKPEPTGTPTVPPTTGGIPEPFTTPPETGKPTPTPDVPLDKIPPPPSPDKTPPPVVPPAKPDLKPIDAPSVTAGQSETYVENGVKYFVPHARLRLSGTPKNESGVAAPSFQVKFQRTANGITTDLLKNPSLPASDSNINSARVSGLAANSIPTSPVSIGEDSTGALASTAQGAVTSFEFRYCVDFPPNTAPYHGAVEETQISDVSDKKEGVGEYNNCSDTTTVKFKPKPVLQVPVKISTDVPDITRPPGELPPDFNPTLDTENPRTFQQTEKPGIAPPPTDTGTEPARTFQQTDKKPENPPPPETGITPPVLQQTPPAETTPPPPPVTDTALVKPDLSPSDPRTNYYDRPAVSGERNDDDSVISGTTVTFSARPKNVGGGYIRSGQFFNIKFQYKLPGQAEALWRDLTRSDGSVNAATVSGGLASGATLSPASVRHATNPTTDATYEFRYCADMPPDDGRGSIDEAQQDGHGEDNNCSGIAIVTFKPRPASPPAGTSPSGTSPPTTGETSPPTTPPAPPPSTPPSSTPPPQVQIPPTLPPVTLPSTQPPPMLALLVRKAGVNPYQHDPLTVDDGSFVDLSWTNTRAPSCNASWRRGAVLGNDSDPNVGPLRNSSSPYRYTVTCGSLSDTVTVHVKEPEKVEKPPAPASGGPPLSCELRVGPAGAAYYESVSLSAGEELELVWKVGGNADSISLMRASPRPDGVNLAGSSRSVFVKNLAVGNYQYKLTASDSAGSISCGASVSVKVETAPLPDLVPSGPPVATDTTDPGKFIFGDTIALAAAPRNQGGATGGTFNVKFQYKLTGQEDRFYSDLPNYATVGGGLPSGATVNPPVTITHPTAGSGSVSYDFRYCVDFPPNDPPYHGLIEEVDENNNCSGSVAVTFVTRSGNGAPDTAPPPPQGVQSGRSGAPAGTFVNPAGNVPPASSGVRACPPSCPKLEVSCSVSPNDIDLASNPSIPVTWTAFATGGVKPYSYEWSGDFPLNEYKNLKTDDKQEIVTFSYNPDTTPRTYKYGSVTLTDSAGPHGEVSASCAGVHGENGVNVRNSADDFSLSAGSPAVINFIGQSALSSKVPITIRSVGGDWFNSTVEVRASGIIDGVSVTYLFYTHGTSVSVPSPAPIAQLNYATGLDMVIRAPKFIKPGRYENIVTVYAEGGGKSHVVPVVVEVNDSRPKFKEF